VTGKGEAFISGLVPERDDLGALLLLPLLLLHAHCCY